MKSILIIEKKTEIINQYTETLKKSGYEVIPAPSSNIGINLATYKVPDLILCNTDLTDIDGFEVLSILSGNSSTTNIPFIFLNPNASPEIIQKGLQLGADDFITKPFQGNQLLRSIKARLDKPKNEYRSSLPIDSSINYAISKNKSLEKLGELISQSKTRHIKKKQTLYYEGDYSQWLYLLVEGCIKTLRLTKDGRQLITGLYKPKSFIGLNTLFIDEPLTESAEAIENSSLYIISKVAVIDILNKYPEINHHFIRILSLNIQEKEEQLVELAYESVRKRLARVLIRINKDTVPIDHIDISRDELAGLAGIATETVSRILSDFKERGLIERSGSQIEIIDHESLENMKN